VIGLRVELLYEKLFHRVLVPFDNRNETGAIRYIPGCAYIIIKIISYRVVFGSLLARGSQQDRALCAVGISSAVHGSPMRQSPSATAGRARGRFQSAPRPGQAAVRSAIGIETMEQDTARQPPGIAECNFQCDLSLAEARAAGRFKARRCPRISGAACKLNG
jgi:hypothetical protein